MVFEGVTDVPDEEPLMLCPLWEWCYGAICPHNTPHKKVYEGQENRCDVGWCARRPVDTGGCDEVTDELLVYYTMRGGNLKEEWIRDIRKMAQKYRIR